MVVFVFSSSTWEAEASGSLSSGLHSEFQISQGYTERPYFFFLKEEKKKRGYFNSNQSGNVLVNFL